MKKELTSKEYWQNSWDVSSKLDAAYFKNPFKSQFKKYISHGENKKYALEVGCVPGIYLGHLAKYFGYNVEGIDYVSGAKHTTQNTLQKFNVTKAKIYEQDFFTWKPKKKYDLVCSFGFIEHFTNVDLVVDQHLELLRDNGTLVLEIPNFSGIQYLLHKFLDRANLERHNTEIMNLEYFNYIARKNNLNIICLEHAGGIFDFWWENTSPNILQRLVFNFLRPLAFFGRKIPLKFHKTSPFIIFIASK